jgi:hypothetical protein
MQTGLTAEGDYNDLSEDNGYKFTGVFSDTFADDTFGVLVSGVYGDTDVRSDAVQEFFVNPDLPGQFDANGDGQISADESDLLGLCCTSFGVRPRSAARSRPCWNGKPLTRFPDGRRLATRLDAPRSAHESYYAGIDPQQRPSLGNVSIHHWVTDMTVAND